MVNNGKQIIEYTVSKSKTILQILKEDLSFSNRLISKIKNDVLLNDKSAKTYDTAEIGDIIKVDIGFEETSDNIVYAVQYHTQGTIAPDLISACVWDADRIRLSWEMGYHEKYFNTAYGNYIASLPPQMSDNGRLSQEQYMKNQNKFLRRHNIKAR